MPRVGLVKTILGALKTMIEDKTEVPIAIDTHPYV